MPSRDHYLQDEESASDSQRLLAPELQQRRLSLVTSDSEEEDFYLNEKGFDIDYSYQKKVPFFSPFVINFQEKKALKIIWYRVSIVFAWDFYPF